MNGRLNLDDKDSTIIFAMSHLQHMNEPVTLKRVATLTAIPYKTIERRISRMRSDGLISNKRIGRYWVWDLSNLQAETAPQNSPSNSPPPKIEKTEQTHDIADFPEDSAPQNSPSVSNMYIPININIEDCNRNNHLAKDTKPIVSRMENFMPHRISGPDTELKSALEQSLRSSTKKCKPTSMNSTPARRLKEKMEQKTIDEYNVTDLRFVFEEAWSGKGWRGFPPRWTMKDKRHVREILNEQGGEITVQYFHYVLKDWENLQRKYRIMGAPSIAVIYGFRSSWMHEALNRIQQTGATVEYRGDEKLTDEDMRF